jgi:hypothetical protein
MILIMLIISFAGSCGCAQKSPMNTTSGTTSPTNATEKVGMVTKGDLDQLKQEIEGLQFDEPGGLSES